MKYQPQGAAHFKNTLVGTILGDSYLSNRGEYACEQTVESCVDLKRQFLQDNGFTVYKHSRDRKTGHIQGRDVTMRRSYVIQTPVYKLFENLREVFYHKDSGKQILDYSYIQNLTPEGLALWIMDDGYVDYKKSSCTRNLRLCTDSFDEITIKNILRYFNEYWNVSASIYMHNRGYGAESKPRVSFNAQNSQILIANIYKYVLPEFLYKLDLHYAEKTLKTKRCIPEYRIAAEYISQHIVPKQGKDIV